MYTKFLSVLIVGFIGALLLRAFVVEAFFVKGDSMLPAMLGGDYVFVNKLAYAWGKGPSVGDVIVAYPREYNEKVVKRVVGVPGSILMIGQSGVYLDPGEYFITGDNSAVSIDSRTFGPVDRWDIKGKVIGAFRFKTFKYIGI